MCADGPHLFGEELVLCFVLPLSEALGVQELRQIHFLLGAQTFDRHKKMLFCRLIPLIQVVF